MKKFLSLLCVVVISLLNFAYADMFDFDVDNLSYNILSETDRTCEVAWSNISEGDVFIPSKVKFNDVEYTVISIGKRAFDESGGGRHITSVTFPETLTTIGEQSFAYCKDLTSLTFPKSLVSIEDGAFFYSNYITSITFPESCSLKTIGRSAFERCYALESLTLPNSLETIETYAFRDCESLTSVIFPESLTVLGTSAFKECVSLPSVTFPKSLTAIGDNAFSGCTSLMSVNFPESLTSIGNGAFDYCTSISSIALPESLITIGASAFAFTAITSLTLPSSLTYIGGMAFMNCKSLAHLIFTEDSRLSKIDYYAFDGCLGLISVTLPESLITIGQGAFEDCIHLCDIILPASLEEIESYAFRGCLNIERIENRNKVPQELEYDAFALETYGHAILKVPDGCVEVYKVDDVWKNFAHIEGGAITGIDEVVQDEGVVTVFTLEGIEVYSGMWNERPELPSGIYVVRVGGKTFKVAL